MEFQARRWVRPEDLNPNNSLFAGRLLEWINEQIGLSTVIQLDSKNFAARNITNINFINPARVGDIVEIGIELIEFGKTSLSFRGQARNYQTKDILLTIDKIIMVRLDDEGNPIPHGKQK